jgi:hypothetical protein
MNLTKTIRTFLRLALLTAGKTAMKTTFLSLLACAGALVLRADPVIQFDDLPSNLTQVPNGYHLLGWNNVFFMNGSTYPFNPSGFGQGIVSSNNVIFGGGGSIASITAQMFDFVSAYATAAFDDNLQLEAKGYLHGTLIFDTTNTLSATAPTLIQFNFCGVDEVDLTSWGGTQHAGYAESGTQFVMDNVNVKTWLPYVPPLLVNAGFETGDLTGWTQSGNTGDTAVTSLAKYVHSGTFGLQIGPVSPGYISQTIPTQIGHTYDVYFWMENAASGVNTWDLTYANGVPIDVPQTNWSAFGWTHFLTGFRAGQPHETLTFEFSNLSSFFGLDDVSIVDTSMRLTDPGFETGDFDWWEVSGNTNDIGVNTINRLGLYGAYAGPFGSPGYISQVVSTDPGQPYLLSCWVQNSNGGGENEYHASWASDTSIYGSTVVQPLADQTNLPAFAWTNLHYTVLSEGYPSELTFGFRNDPGYFHLDEVSLWPVPLIQNGSFEFGDFSGWTTNGNFGSCSISMISSYANDGFYGAKLGPIGSLGYISQTIPTVPGQGYLIRFELENPQVMVNSEFKVTWNGTVLMDTTNDAVVGWQTNQFVVAATGTNATLQFGFRDDPAYLGLDNVSVTPVQQPYIEAISQTNSTATLRLNVLPEYLYQLQYTTNLTHQNWNNIGVPGISTGYPWYVTDPNPTDNQRFYRVQMLPPQ